MPAYQLRCVCSAVNLVSVGQAGGTLACQACGKILDIPKLRNFHLMEMEEATVRSPVNAGWGFPQGFMLFGIVIAVASFTLAGVLAVPAGSEINSELIRSNVDAALLPKSIKRGFSLRVLEFFDHPPSMKNLRFVVRYWVAVEHSY